MVWICAYKYIYIYILILLHGVQEQINQRADVVGENFGRFILRMR